MECRPRTAIAVQHLVRFRALHPSPGSEYTPILLCPIAGCNSAECLRQEIVMTEAKHHGQVRYSSRPRCAGIAPEKTRAMRFAGEGPAKAPSVLCYERWRTRANSSRRWRTPCPTKQRKRTFCSELTIWSESHHSVRLCREKETPGEKLTHTQLSITGQ